MKMKRYILYIIAALASLLALSCTQEEIASVGEQGDPDCYGVYFPAQDGTGDIQIDPEDARHFTFKVNRTKATEAITVPVNIISEDSGIFTVSELNFAEDERTSEVSVYFPTAQLGKTYECTLIIDDPKYASAYSSVSNHISFSVTRVKWNRVLGPNGETTGLYRDAVLRDWFMLQNPDYEKPVTIEERDDRPGYYRIYDVYDENFIGTLFNANASGLCIDKTYMYIDATDPEKVWIPTFKAGLMMMPEYGEISIGSYVADNEDFDASISSVYGKFEEGVITFPSGALQMKMENMGWYQGNASGKHRIIFPGYRAKNYDLSLSAGVSNEKGVLPVSVDFGQDIVQVKLAVFEGELTSSAAAEKGALIAEEDPSVGKVITLTDRSDVYYTFNETGEYTVVASAFDIGGNLHTTDYVVFGYVKEGDDAKKIKFSLGLIASDKYASEGLTAENALEIYMNGKNIERLHVALHEMEEWQRDSVSILENMRESQMTASYLAQVNGEGMTLKQGYLIPGTEYILVAIAYNGFREAVFTATEWTKGKWDARLASYDLSDINLDIAVPSPEGYTGKYHNYAISSGMYSREYLGDVDIVMSDSRTDAKETGTPYQCVTISGLFPRCQETYGLPDDSVDFFYYSGYIYNYRQRFSEFYWEGLYIYPSLLLLSTDGGAYGASAGMMGGFVRDGYLAIVDSGQYSSYDLEFDGFAILAFSDENQNTFMGAIEITRDMLLVRSDLDPNPIVSEKDDEDEDDDKVTKQSIEEFRGLVKKGPDNLVETFEGFLMSTIDRIKQAVPKSKLDWDTVQVSDNPFEFHAPDFEVRVDSKLQ